MLCLPRCRDAINTRVNIINSSLKRTSYRRMMKIQSRGFSFGMPEFLTVPFGKKETVNFLLNSILIYLLFLLFDFIFNIVLLLI